MTDFLDIARGLEMLREDRKWYANVLAVVDALMEADRAAYERGVNDGLTGHRERAVRIMPETVNKVLERIDEYAPPVGPVATCNEETAQASAKVEIETPGAFYRGTFTFPKIETREDVPQDAIYFLSGGKVAGIITGLALPRDYAPVPQPDGDGRFPGEAE